MRTSLPSVLVAAAAAAVLFGCNDADVATPDATPDAGSADAEMPPLLSGDDGIDHWDEAVVDVADGTLAIAAKVADTSERRQQGLMRVPELPDEAGMLFLFEQANTGGFWMRNTLVPLDIAYLDEGEIVTIREMDPCAEMPCETYDPDAPYTAALEVRQGLLTESGVEVGDRVTWTEPVAVG